eukprot:COSAG02_NODE_707_length_18254_cov_20.685872_17_plen_128_part_00
MARLPTMLAVICLGRAEGEAAGSDLSGKAGSDLYGRAGSDLYGGCTVALTQQISATKCVVDVNFGCNANNRTMWIQGCERRPDKSLPPAPMPITVASPSHASHSQAPRQIPATHPPPTCLCCGRMDG